MAHRLRVKNQRDSIDGMMEKVKDNQAVILIDYKIKFECEHYREKTSESCDKKGLSWHGGMICSRRTQVEKYEEDKDALLPFKTN